MSVTELILDIFKFSVPSLVVLGTTYYLVNAFLDKEKRKDNQAIKSSFTSITLPLRLQAYERICLFLERISPNIMFHRVNKNVYNALDLQRALLSDIRKEFEHNLSQQVYVSPTAWILVSRAKEDLLNVIIMASKGMTAKNTNMELIKAISDKLIHLEESPTQKAVNYIKEEISRYF